MIAIGKFICEAFMPATPGVAFASVSPNYLTISNLVLPLLSLGHFLERSWPNSNHLYESPPIKPCVNHTPL